MISMKKANIVINVFKYLSPKTHVFLKPKFRTKLFEKCIRKFETNRKFSEFLKTNETSTREWRTGKKNPPLWAILRMIEILNINENLLCKNTLWVTSYFYEGRISTKNWQLSLDGELSEWLGLLVGDGTITIDYISIHNNCLDVIFFFKKVLEKFFGISLSQMETTIRYSPESTETAKIKDIENLLRINGISRIKLDTNSGGFRRIEPNIVLRVSSRVLSQLLRNIIKELHELINFSNNKVKIGYVKGFSAAEGSVYNSRGFRAISINQKGTKELRFIKSLLNDVGINHVSNPKRLRDGFYHLVITTKKEIKNFKNLIGFGSHTVKNKRLEEVLAMYKKDLPYQMPRKIRYQDILKILEKNGKATCKNISDILKIESRYINRLLNEMLDKKIISVDRSSRCFVYSLYNGLGRARSEKCFFVPASVRFKEILGLLKENKKMTSKQIASKLSVGYSGIIKVIRKTKQKNLISIDTCTKPPVYFINKERT